MRPLAETNADHLANGEKDEEPYEHRHLEDTIRGQRHDGGDDNADELDHRDDHRGLEQAALERHLVDALAVGVVLAQVHERREHGDIGEQQEDINGEAEQHPEDSVRNRLHGHKLGAVAAMPQRRW